MKIQLGILRWNSYMWLQCHCKGLNRGLLFSQNEISACYTKLKFQCGLKISIKLALNLAPNWLFLKETVGSILPRFYELFSNGSFLFLLLFWFAITKTLMFNVHLSEKISSKELILKTTFQKMSRKLLNKSSHNIGVGISYWRSSSSVKVTVAFREK